ncbi:MAG: Chromate resistance protein ChrB [Bacteroidales bacterium]
MNWRTLIYQIPREPQKNRMAVWRRLKSVGAINVLQSIWILPETKESKEEFKKLEEQINNSGGKSISCITLIDEEAKNKKLIEQFNKEREEDYKELFEKCDDFGAEIERETKRENFTFAEVEENEHEIDKLNTWLRKIEKKDYFGCPMKDEILKRIDECSSLLNEFSNKVFEINENQ